MRRLATKTTLIGCILAVIALTAPAMAISSLANEHAAAAQTANQTRLEGAKLMSCQRHETVINNIMGRIAKRGQRHLQVFSTIATRVENFYTDKNLSVSNYDELVADVDAKKTAAQATIDKISSDKVSFKCDGSDPKGAAAGFKTDLKAQIQALHDYQQSIKNLIVAVKSAQSDASAANGSSSEGGGQ